MYISSRHKQHIIDTSDTDICYKKSTESVSPNQNLLEVTLTNTLCRDTHIENVLKTCNSYPKRYTESTCFKIFKNGNCSLTHTF